MNKIGFDLQNPENAAKLSFFLGNGQVVLVTSCDAQKKLQGILTASWMTPTSHFPFLISVSVGNGREDSEEDNYRTSYSLIEDTLEFGINFPSKELIKTVGKIGTLHSNQVDKYSETGLTAMESTIIRPHLIKECYLNAECKVTDEYVTGDHTVFVAEVVAVHLDQDVLVDGKFSEKYRSKQNQIHFGDIVEMWNMW